MLAAAGTLSSTSAQTTGKSTEGVDGAVNGRAEKEVEAEAAEEEEEEETEAAPYCSILGASLSSKSCARGTFILPGLYAA